MTQIINIQAAESIVIYLAKKFSMQNTAKIKETSLQTNWLINYSHEHK